MKPRILLCTLAVAFLLPQFAQAYCVPHYGYHWVQYESSEGVSGHWQWGELYSVCYSGGGGYYEPAGPGGGLTGGGGLTREQRLEQERTSLTEQYTDINCDGRQNPTESEFVSATSFPQMSRWDFHLSRIRTMHGHSCHPSFSTVWI